MKCLCNPGCLSYLKPGRHFLRSFLFFLAIALLTTCQTESDNRAIYEKALKNGVEANEGYRRCRAYLHAWLEHADPVTGLIPENLGTGVDRWTPKNSAADNYPFMVLVSALTDSTLFHGRMAEMLETEIRLSSRIGNMPDAYSFSRETFVDQEADLSKIIFGASEYVKDGLLPLSEWLGPSPWSDRMIAITDDVWAHAAIPTEQGPIPSLNVEVNGEQLQILSRLYWMTGEQKYLDWALRLGDYYLLGSSHPTRDFESLRLNDHGCEIVSGLCELYATVHFALPEKKALYQGPVHEMLDRIQEVGTNEHGLFYVSINPKTGEILDSMVRDNWGYNYNGYYTVYLIDQVEKYREALLFAFSNLQHYRNYNWEKGSADGFADAIEGGLNLYNREKQPGVAEWLDSETRIMWSLQDSSYQENARVYQNQGIIEGWHGDGNFARTTIMYCLWKSQGTRLYPWREDLVAGAALKDQTLYLSVRADRPWDGRLVFDTPRSKENLNLPLDWPRINQFPEWYVVCSEKDYRVLNHHTGSTHIYTGAELAAGIDLAVPAQLHVRLEIFELQ